MARTLDIADAVVVELAGAPPGTFGMAFTPQRRVLPQFELGELKDLHVTVVPRAVEIENVSRAHSQHDVQIDIGVQKRLGKELDADIEPLLELVEQIADYLRQRPLGSIPAVWVRTVNDPIYAADHLAEDRVFTSVLTMTYRAMV